VGVGSTVGVTVSVGTGVSSVVALLLGVAAAISTGGAVSVVVSVAVGVTAGVVGVTVCTDGVAEGSGCPVEALTGAGTCTGTLETLTGRLRAFSVCAAVVSSGGIHAPSAPMLGTTSGPAVAVVRGVVVTAAPRTPVAVASGATAVPASADRLAAASATAATASPVTVRGVGTVGGARWRPAGGSIL
jgi:hypothetical protein